MATSTNYGWAEPDNSSLVKNGASDIRTLGDAIDTSVWNIGFGQAGKNKFINGDCFVNQRNFSSSVISTSTATYGIDRWKVSTDAGSGTVTYSVQAFTTGTAPVAGYESKQFARVVTTGQTLAGTYTIFSQSVEDVRNFSGQTATVSFWAKAASGTPKVALEIEQERSAGVTTRTYLSQVTIGTSWTRYSMTVAIPAVSGTIGSTNGKVDFNFWVSAGATYNSNTGSIGIQSNTFDFWGLQVEYGSKATPFQTATGSIQQELAACQRYYYQIGGTSLSGGDAGNGHYYNSTNAYILTTFPVTMRTAPTCSFANIANWSVYSAGSGRACTAFGASSNSPYNAVSAFTTSAATAGNGGWLEQTNANAALTFSAEL